MDLASDIWKELIEHVTYGDNSRGKVLGLGRIAISKDLSISNVLFVEALSFNLFQLLNYVILD